MTEKTIVSKLEQPLNLTCYEATPYKAPRHGENLDFEVNVVAEPLGKMHKRATIEPNLPTWGTFVINCDEGTALGGEDSAPPPLGYLSSGIAFCLLTHFTSIINRKKLKIDKLRVEQRMRFTTNLLAEQVKDSSLKGGCPGLETHIVIESSEPEEKLQDLVQLAEQSCLALAAIVSQTPTSTQVHINGNTVDNNA